MSEESKRRLSEGLARLQAELENLEADEATRQRLGDLARRVERQLEAGGEESHDSLLKELEAELLRFEVEHPRLTAILNDIMVALANMGI
ncbi:hypothetical protein MIT9_P2039 [Methylomarinovum caldicuralii]|uniref:DUF4404 family protein n=1 Tax=Methylomarinovum caldicuralii TaxID=438856 RepID=A0AAU9C400_9GAMM|nr:DUF4404 family protein [Methylomarinovum caldicuralii]BCX82453.1 hypothetical protein MIT9_P2039 [Methylomarinovum caldicuralii]